MLRAPAVQPPSLARAAPIVREASLQIADPQVRYVGTVGGNVANGDPGNDMPGLMQCLDASFTLVGPDGTRYANESVFAKIEADHQVVIDHTCAPLFRLTITLEPEGNGTRVHWLQVFDDPAFAQAMKHILEPANEQNLDRLGAELGLA